MKYSELIQFEPIEGTIQLREMSNAQKATDIVKTYVMSDSMAENLKSPVLDQLQMDEVIDNKGILIVGNYGTGKSHLMSLISALATDANNLQYVHNKKFSQDAKCIAGKFEVLRIEFNGQTMSLYDVLLGEIEDDFKNRGINFKKPEYPTVRDPKKVITNAMALFEEKYSDKGYLIIIDEFLAYLSSRNQQQLSSDLEIMRAFGEMCSKSKLRVIFGVQEKIFDNPKFSFVSDTLKKVGDRFTQMTITKEATSYVVSERILKKTPEQKAKIREHLEKFSSLYTGMASRMDEFVELYPIHPSYIDVFTKVYVIETRHILKNISRAIKDVFDSDVPDNAPGIISFDDYWPAIKTNGMLKTDESIRKVVDVSGQLEDIINRSFPKAIYKPLAIKIIYALSVHRLTTANLEVKFGLSAENLKDDLCLFMQEMPEMDADFLLSAVKQTLKEIMTTVSGQFIIFNEDNNQYYIDVDKTVDYDEKVKQKISLLSDSDFNQAFYQIIYKCMEWDAKKYVGNFEIYEYDINWKSHNMYREGYLFLGLPGERSTAQPERDFYIHFLPPFGTDVPTVQNLDDEVYLYFKNNDSFKTDLEFYAAASTMATISEGKDRDAYQSKADVHRRKLIRYLSDNKNTCFDISYKGNRKTIVEVLQTSYSADATFKDVIDTASSICLDSYFSAKYPEYPVMKTRITKSNINTHIKNAIDHFAGRKSQASANILAGFNLLENDRLKIENSKWVSYYADMVNGLQGKSVINFDDIFGNFHKSEYYDKKFKLENDFAPIIFLALVANGNATITLKNNTTISAGNLETVIKLNPEDFKEFKYISKPTGLPLRQLQKLFEVMDIPLGKITNPNDREDGVKSLVEKANDLTNKSCVDETKIDDSFALWAEPLVDSAKAKILKDACKHVKEEFTNYDTRFNTVGKLNNFSLTEEQIEQLDKDIKLLDVVENYLHFKSSLSETVLYISNIENVEGLSDPIKTALQTAKNNFRQIRDNIYSGSKYEDAVSRVQSELEQVRKNYIDFYIEKHNKKRLNSNETKRKGDIQEGLILANLKKLNTLPFLATSKLDSVIEDLADLKTCFELSSNPGQLKHSPFCRCGFRLDEKNKDITGMLDNIENRLDDILGEQTTKLFNTISDPLVEKNKVNLDADQKKVVEAFISSKKLPERIDDFFIKSIESLMQEVETITVNAADVIEKLECLGSCDIDSAKRTFNDIIDSLAKNQSDKNKIRLIFK